LLNLLPESVDAVKHGRRCGQAQTGRCGAAGDPYERANVLSEGGEYWRQGFTRAPDTEGIRVHLELLLIAERVVLVEVESQGLAKVIAGEREASAHRGFSVIGRPGNRDARLEVVFCPVIERFSAVGRTRLRNGNGGKIILALEACQVTILEILSQRHGGLSFVSVSFVYRPLQAVADTGGQGEARAKFKGVLHIPI